MTTRSTRRALVALSLAGAALLGACGGDDEPDEALVEGPQQDNSEATLVAYVEEFLEGFLAESGANTYPTLSAECQNEWSQEEWAANAASWSAFTESVANTPATELQVVNVEVLEIDEDSATLTVELANAAGEIILNDDGMPLANDEREWIHENGGWRSTECDSLGEALSS